MSFGVREYRIAKQHRSVSLGHRVAAAVARFHAWGPEGLDTRIVGHDRQAVWTAQYTTRRALWGQLGRKVDPTGLIVGILAATLAVLVPVEQHRLQAAQARATALALHAGNLLAERDSTRNVALTNARLAALLGDSMRLVEKRVQQIAQSRDRLDRVLGGERRARYALSATVNSLQASMAVAAAPDTSGPVPQATFRVRQPPYTVLARVDFPDHPDTARLALSVSLDPIPIEARVRCSTPDSNGVRTASLAVSAPPWATINLAHLEQAPALCAAPVVRTPSVPRIAFTRLLVGVGIAGRGGGSLTWGWFVGTGFAVGI